MFLLSIAALAVYWKYIRENMPLDYHYPVNNNRSSSPNGQANHAETDVITSDDGRHSYYNTIPTISNYQPIHNISSKSLYLPGEDNPNFDPNDCVYDSTSIHV